MYRLLPPRWSRLNLHILIFLYRLYLHIALCFKLAMKLVDFLLHGTRTWIIMTGRMLVFVTVLFLLLLPVWCKLIAYFLYDPNVIRNVPYSNKSITSRNYLDIYLPARDVVCSIAGVEPAPAIELTTSLSTHSLGKGNGHKKKFPVVIFVSGGAWIIGYKMWSTLVARAMSSLGTVVICPDYRNVPQGGIEDMMCDITNSIKWTITNIDEYGGDANHINLAGQSAGAHISMSLILDAYDAIMPSNEVPSLAQPRGDVDIARLTAFELEKIKVVIGVNGPYNLHVLDKHLHQRGLDTSILHWVCNNDVDKFSPTLKLQKISDRIKNFALHGTTHQHRRGGSKHPLHVPKFPPVALYHGSDDATVPSDISVEFADVLRKCGLDVTINIYQNLSHTDLILEGPLQGDNKLLRDIMNLIQEKQQHRMKQENGMFAEVIMDPPRSGKTIHFDIDEPLAPTWLVKIARKMNPF